MITLYRKKGVIPYRIIWFDPKPTFKLWPLTVYYQSPAGLSLPRLTSRPFYTLVSDLAAGPKTLLAAMNGSARNSINQMEKAEIVGSWTDIEPFLDFFNAFATEKKIEGATPSKLESFGATLRLSVASINGRPLSMHATIVDPEVGRARLLLSASARFLDPEDRNLIGKANRWLHWWNMKTLQAEGFASYDWGGYAKDTTDPAKVGINQFKEGFGGVLREEAHYFPFYLAGLGE